MVLDRTSFPLRGAFQIRNAMVYLSESGYMPDSESKTLINGLIGVVVRHCLVEQDRLISGG